MNGVGKQTNSIHYSIKSCVIKRMDDGKGIGRRVNQNPSSRGTPTEFKGRASICCTTLLTALPSGASSRLGEPIKQKLQPVGGTHRVLDQEIESFPLD